MQKKINRNKTPLKQPPLDCMVITENIIYTHATENEMLNRRKKRFHFSLSTYDHTCALIPHTPHRNQAHVHSKEKHMLWPLLKVYDDVLKGRIHFRNKYHLLFLFFSSSDFYIIINTKRQR